MDVDRYTPGRGSTESAAWFRTKPTKLGLSQTALARLMIRQGDDRQLTTIQRTLGLMATGSARVLGDARADRRAWPVSGYMTSAWFAKIDADLLILKCGLGVNLAGVGALMVNAFVR